MRAISMRHMLVLESQKEIAQAWSVVRWNADALHKTGELGYHVES